MMDDLRKRIEQQVRAEFAKFAEDYRAHLSKYAPPDGETPPTNEFHRRCMDKIRTRLDDLKEADIAEEVERRMQIISESGT